VGGFDVIVVGLGVNGAAAAWRLAQRGARVLGLDARAPSHALGSSHGRTRIIREAYFEHPLYVPLVRRAYDGWVELEQAAGRPLLKRTGGLMIGPPTGTLVAGSRASARAHDVPHELLHGDALAARFPALRAPPGAVALLEHRAGVLRAEESVQALHGAACAAGARLEHGAEVAGWTASAAGVDVVTADGRRFRAGRLLLAAGAWLPGLLPDVALPLAVERQSVHWFEPTPGTRVGPEDLPILLHEYDDGRYLYAFPADEAGIKAALHHQGTAAHPDSVDRSVTAQESAAVRACLDAVLPGAAGPRREAVVCLYTNSPDGHFIIDRHPRHEAVVVLSACSGHGFKFAPATGDVAAGLLLEGRPGFDLAPFRIDRFQRA
jgi:sarcosine oxidase